MRKHSDRIWICALLFISGSVSAILPPNACAASLQHHTDFIMDGISGYLKETGQGDLPIVDSVKIPAAPEFIGWNATWWDLYVNWGVDRQFLGHKLTVKLGFLRGSFDPYTQTYKSEPVITVIDNSVENDCSVSPYLSRGETMRINFTKIGAPILVKVEFIGQTITVSNNSNPAQQMSIPYDDLLGKWLEFASRQSASISGKKYYFIPQTVWSGSRYHAGFVVTANTPLYYTTNLPQDFVELYKTEAGNVNYKPIAHSLALRLAFVLSPDQKNIWGIRPMTPEEIGEAMVEGAKSRVPARGSLLPTTTKAKR